LAETGRHRLQSRLSSGRAGRGIRMAIFLQKLLSAFALDYIMDLIGNYCCIEGS